MLKIRFSYLSISILVFTSIFFGSNTQIVNASSYSKAAALPNPAGMILPAHVSTKPKYGISGAHLSGFARRFKNDTNQVITNNNTKTSSIDIVFNGSVVAPISGTIRIPASCASSKYPAHQIVFIQNADGTAIGLTHIALKNEIKSGSIVTKGQIIGKTAWPIPTSASTSLGCGYGTSPHIHLTLMKWTKGSGNIINYSEQSIVNNYISQWIVKNTYLDGPRNDVQTGRFIEDIVKISSPHPFRNANGYKIIEGRDTGVVRTMFFVPGNLKQTWNLISIGDGYYYFKNMQYNKCLSIENSSAANNAKAILQDCTGASSQQFQYVTIANALGKIAIKAKHSGKVLDIPVNWSGDPFAGNGDALQIQQYDAFYGTNQQWIISKP